MKRFFAAINSYASNTDIGFANTWQVIAFSSRKARDAYVESATDIATRAIRKKDIGKYIDRPKPFSTEHWGIMDWLYWENETDGKLGYVECVPDQCHSHDSTYKGRVYS